ncbi:HET-domain-containing protein, partial [Hyaloscypha hepaticicola]
SPSPRPIIGVGRQVSSDSASDECVQLAASWIKNCAEFHQDCLHLDHTPLPTRVIHVGSDLEEPFLYISKRENAEYIALSHCWGGMVPLTTTLATLEQRQREIRFSELPRTFRDAITITRKLGVQYIWIDSLCIIQDSAEDWEKEAVKMGAVYRNSLVCIAADGSLNSNGGCFIEGHPSRNLDVACIRCPGLEGAESSIYVRRRPTTMRNGFAHIRFGAEPCESILDTRGWVLQEQSLSRRTLHYTVAEMSWDCATCFQCECTSLAEQPTHQKWSQSSRWVNFVELFTQRDLTYHTDRLYALSGMAATMSPSAKGSFLAGLWKEELPLGLLWRTQADYHTRKTLVSRRHQKYYAPSWSWASLTGPIEYIALPGREYSFELATDLTILEAICIPAGASPHGPVRSGYLKVSGLLAPIHHEAKFAKPGDVHDEENPIRRGFDCDVLVNGEAIEFVDGEPLWILLVAHGVRISRGFSKLEGHHCIILRMSPLQHGAFERVGCAWALKEYWDFELSKKAEMKSIFLL